MWIKRRQTLIILGGREESWQLCLRFGVENNQLIGKLKTSINFDQPKTKVLGLVVISAVNHLI